MQTRSKCQQEYSEEQKFCLEDGEILSLQDPYHLVGRILSDKYRIDALVGIGGMGAVYSAHQLATDRHVAFKILQPNIAVRNRRMIDLFEREAKTASRLLHENSVIVMDAGRAADGIVYIVMEWLEGHTLEEELETSGPLSFERAADILRQIAAALEAAHAAHLIHRDLKPSNVMLVKQPDGQERVKVLDFGIAKIITETEGSPVSAVMGTPHYASPEQFQVGAHIDKRADIYSLGVMLYHMLTGALPFDAPSIRELIQLQLTASPPRLRQLRPDATEAVEQLVSRMLAKDPSERPQRMSEVTALFDRALKNLPDDKKSDDNKRLQVETSQAETLIDGLPTQPQGRATRVSGFLSNIAPRPSRSRLTSFVVSASLGMVILICLGWWYLKSAPEGMVYVSGGELRMGRDNGEENERPSHLVTVKPFFIDQTEVTNEQYQKFVDATEHDVPPAWQGARFPAGAEKLPVTDVTWEDAQAYAQWAGKRLPTEEEWEFAARGAEARLYPWGNEPRPDAANVSQTNNEKRKLSPVGQYPLGASPFGALDMAGNAWEWTGSEYQVYPGGNRSEDLAGYSNLKVIRGGSYAGPRHAAIGRRILRLIMRRPASAV